MPTMHDSNEGQTQHMTDTQEAMRKAFEKSRGHYVDFTRNPDGSYANWDLQCRWLEWESCWQAATAQSAEKMARLEAENATMRENLVTVRRQSAAAELSNKQLREALDKARNGIVWYSENSDDADDSDTEMLCEIDAALAQQPSTEALDAYVAKLIPPGWVAVPVEMTDAMQLAVMGAARFWFGHGITRAAAMAMHEDMINALPPAPEKE